MKGSYVYMILRFYMTMSLCNVIGKLYRVSNKIPNKDFAYGDLSLMDN